MPTTAFWSPEFLADIIEALGVSLGRVSSEHLELDPRQNERWEQAQAWLKEAQSAKATSTQEDAYATLRPFPLTGAQLGSLQMAVDKAAQTRRRKRPTGESFSKSSIEALGNPPITAHARLGLSLNKVQISSLVVVSVLALMLVIDVAELLILRSLGMRVVVWTNITLSILAIGAWAVLHYHILAHAHFFRGLHPRLASSSAFVGLLRLFRPHLSSQV
jgi:hypothetical protein